MKEHLEQLLRYEKWANKKILDALKTMKEQDERCLDLMSHILLVQMVWHNRIVNIAQPPIWDKKPLAELYKMHEENSKTLDAFFAKLTDKDFHNVVKYKDSKGNPYENTLKDLLAHLFNHSTHHRGQIKERLRGKVAEMPTTDLIFFLREK
ncbi:MAG TPA: DinB family protein [Bacteroidia bacterium]|jgi:uncharacterized damage-inducible protein DinB|nr:DinB family protein [Bacteroidia bacterium]